MSKKIDDAIVIFPIYGQFRARKPDSERIACKTYIFYNSKLLSFKNLKQNKKGFNSYHTEVLSKGQKTPIKKKKKKC